MNYNIVGWIVAENPVVLCGAELQGAWVDGGGREVPSLPVLSFVIGIVDTGLWVTGEDKLAEEVGGTDGGRERGM